MTKLFITNLYRTGRYYIRSFLGRVRLLLNRRKLRQSMGDWVIVLSLGRNGPAPNVTKELWNRGYRVHVLCPEFPARERNYIHSWEKVSGLEDITHLANYSGLISSLKRRKPVAVMLEAKNLLLPAQVRISEALGLKSLGNRAVETSNSKIAMRSALDTLDGRQLPWHEVTDLSRITLSFPAIIKPDRGTASKGVILVQSHEDLALVAKKNQELKNDISVGDRRLVEGFVQGRQFDMEGLAQDGKYIFFVCVEEYYEGRAPYFPPQWHYFNPPISSDLRQALERGAAESLRALGVRHGGFHIEMRIDANGDVFALDYANRMGYNELVTLGAGSSFPGGYVDTMLDRIKLENISFDRKPVFNLFCQDEGTMAMAQGFRQAYPGNVIRFSSAPFQIGHTQFHGRITITDTDDVSLFLKLKSLGGVPEQFALFYPDLVRSVKER